MSREQISVEEFHSRLKAQDVSAREHVALVCPICATPQSLASLIAAGCEPERAERCIGFSCEGRWTDAGPWKDGREGRGCDWTLGGLFQFHKLEVVTEDGKAHPSFEPATPEQARALEAEMTSKP